MILKKVKSRLNKYLKDVNKSLAADKFLGEGRFKIREVAFERNTNWFVLEITDTKTGESLRYNNHIYSVSSKHMPSDIFWFINDFIVEVRHKEGW